MAYVCKHPTCSELISERGYCVEHIEHANDKQRHYDQLVRDAKAKQFYNSTAWKRTREKKLTEDAVCQYPECIQIAEHVHHVEPISTPEGWEARLDLAGLMSLCQPHHNTVEAELRRQGKK